MVGGWGWVGHEKLIYRRKLPKKGELGKFADFLRGGGGSDTPMHTMNLTITLTVILIY